MSQPTAAAPRLYEIGQVAELLGCSKPHVYRLIKAGSLPVIDISTPGSSRSKSRVRADHLNNYIETGTWYGDSAPTK